MAGTAGTLTGVAREGVDLVGVEAVVFGNVHELLVAAAEAQLVALGHPARLLLAVDVEEARLREGSGRVGPERDEGIDGVGVRLEGGRHGGGINGSVVRNVSARFVVVAAARVRAEHNLAALLLLLRRARRNVRTREREEERGAEHRGVANNGEV